ncbi:heavy-metal-associated domain-containing protein [Corynebacterium suicordis]|uniref:Heavy-metal-associated domain-containing protein n=1 Tax=Corynebacterium suicordis DSM 45110 TaxID=1121369 RepID=A0ABR9ZIC2_9CORY|nr:heavy metal-associated domain-containing protein [Corynebacterium suicordis]MBF4553114.1 heavy-metal-associated domain-containing protein [Corynebacterium suicordis DSM 45110]MDR6277923.1 copper chaperone CopZ [Corynebacterium suicordis]
MAITTEYEVTGMSCGHCENAVHEEVSEIPGVTGIEVSADTGKLVISSQDELDDNVVVSAVEEAGYNVLGH